MYITYRSCRKEQHFVYSSMSIRVLTAAITAYLKKGIHVSLAVVAHPDADCVYLPYIFIFIKRWYSI